MFIFNILGALAKQSQLNAKGLELVNKILEEICPLELVENDDYQALRGKEIFLSLTDIQAHYILEVPQATLGSGSWNQGATESTQKEPLLVVKDGASVDHSSLVPDLKIITNTQTIKALVNKESDLEELIASSQVKIEGNQNLLINLINLSNQIDYSPEHILSKFIGDVPAYFLANAGERLVEIGQALNNFISGLGETSSPTSTTDPFIDHSRKDDSLKGDSNGNNLLPDASLSASSVSSSDTLTSGAKTAVADPFQDHSQESQQTSEGLPHPLEVARSLIDDLSGKAKNLNQGSSSPSLATAKEKVESVLTKLPPASALEEPLADLKTNLSQVKAEEVKDFVNKVGEICSSIFNTLKK